MNLATVERWLAGWTMPSKVPMPLPCQGRLVVELGKPEKLRRYVFVEAGQTLLDRADRIRDSYILLIAAVSSETLRKALTPRWNSEILDCMMMNLAQSARELITSSHIKLSPNFNMAGTW